MPIQLSINIGETVGQTYITEKLLAAGKTSNVFVARSKLNTEAKRVALKVYPIDIEQSTLNNDIAVLQSIGGKTHFSNCLEQGTYRKFSYLALELLGPTLSDIMKRPQMKKLNLSSVVKVGIQGLEALSILHSAGFVHGQVCMENFAIGYTQETAGNLYLIDFTGSKRIDDESLNKGNKTNEDRLSTKIRLVQNDLQCLMKMMMTLYRGGEEV
ncbi:MAG: hypothetical protein EZS28_018631 [Streblomastix strix]|uniref:Protein kinase domain-containing protein n=1 Tax=Streblomastix strix TaxID=222440 RepID=A0A5J4VU53_9EUKA|nr:MAG: hypothetical protein EZS28_018631 [Streblomastix strix]